MVKEASKAMKRRAKAKEYINQYFVGNGIDIGSGIDCIDQFKKKFKNMKSVKPWDLIDGDATYLDKEMEDLYDFVHSSHCLEHLTDPFTALKNWIRVCKPGGYIIVTIPDEEMFEKLKWPSQFNPDHKWSFTIYNKEKRLPNSVNILDLLQAFENVKIISINVIEQGFNPNVPQSFDQTLSGSAECSIEFVLRKKALNGKKNKISQRNSVQNQVPYHRIQFWIQYSFKILEKYLKPLFQLNLFQFKRELYFLWFKWIQPRLRPSIKTPSTVPLDIIILAIEKDLDVLPYAIDYARKNVLHPIREIFIISPNTADSIKQLAIEKNCTFIDENTVLPITKNDIIHIFKGQLSAPHLLQVMLKLNCDTVAKQENFLILDADTLFFRPQVFKYKNKVILNLADEYYVPYFKFYKKIFTYSAKSPLSFVSHHMLYNKSILSRLKREIELRHKGIWFQVLLNNIEGWEICYPSEFETYGNYLWTHYPDNVRLEYWFNRSLYREELQDMRILEQKFQYKYKAISFHSYKITK